MSVMVGLDLYEDFTIILICSSFFSLLTMLDSFYSLSLSHILLEFIYSLIYSLHVVTNLMPITWCQSKQSMQSQEGMGVALSTLDELKK